jgi:predicted amidohydrolase YtcJ
MLVYFDMNADLRVSSIAALACAAQAARGAGAWLGAQLQDETWLSAGRRPAPFTPLPGRPVVVVEHDGHSAIGNGAALAARGSVGTPDPPGGRIARGADGAPSAGVRTAAKACSAPPVLGTCATARASSRGSAHGITSAGVIVQTDEEGFRRRRPARSVAQLLRRAPFATYTILVGRSVDAAVAARATPLHDPAAGRRVGGFKIFADGTFGSCTACMREPFSDRPGERGLPDASRGRSRAHARRPRRAPDLRARDRRRASSAASPLRAPARRGAPRDHRHRIEHASIVPAAQIARMARLGICVSTQPLFIHSEKEWLHRRLGAARARDVYPLRALVDGGVRVGGASDAPVESLDVLHAIQCCVTREGFETHQALAPGEALDLFTRGARASSSRRRRGQPRPASAPTSQS